MHKLYKRWLNAGTRVRFLRLHAQELRIVTWILKGGICHFVNLKIRPFNKKMTLYNFFEIDKLLWMRNEWREQADISKF